MLDLMQTYGSEVSDHTHLSSAMTSGKRKVQKASIVRQFRRWNPNFHEYFRHEGGKWVPKLGRQGELDRRARNRAERRLRKVVGGGGSNTNTNNNKSSPPASVGSSQQFPAAKRVKRE